MRAKLSTMAVVALLLVSVAAFGQMPKRPDAIWARTTSAAITVDGKLTEAAWASAESLRVQMGKSSGDPGWPPFVSPAVIELEFHDKRKHFPGDGLPPGK